MGFASYSQLREAVAGWIDRQDLSDRIPDFVTICEARMRRLIKHDVGLSNTVSFTPNDGVYTLPDDFSGVITLASNDPCSPQVGFKDPTDFIQLPPYGYGAPYWYTIVGQQLQIYPNVEVEFALTYRVKIDLLRFGPNWILEEHPDAYLYGTLAAAEPYILEDERLPLWKSLFEETMAEISNDGQRLKYSGPLQMTSNGYA